VLQPPLIWLNFFLNDGLNHPIYRIACKPNLNPNGLVAQAEIGVYIARSSAFTRQSAALVPCRLKAELQTGQFADASYFTSVLQNRSMRSKPFSRFAMLVA
jgi:hypothetical protein